MEENNEIPMDEIKKLAQSDAAKKLMAMLDQNTAGAVRQSAQSGNMEEAQKALSSLLHDPRAQALLRQLEEQNHG